MLNEEKTIARVLDHLDRPGIEVIVVDGGSHDETCKRARRYAFCQVIESSTGRALQMNAGAAVASGDVLLFLHADTLLPDDFLARITGDFWSSGKAWGRFDVKLSGDHPALRLIESMINIRSRLSGVCTGDQAIFIKREIFEQISGFAAIPLMEDIEITRRLRKISWPFRIGRQLTTSSRRWHETSILRTVLLMWHLRLMYFVGVSPEILAKQYYPDLGKKIIRKNSDSVDDATTHFL